MKLLVGSAVARLSRIIAGCSVEGTLPNDTRQRIYFANHTSHLDFVTIWAALPVKLRRITRPVAARDYWDKPGLRGYLAREVFNAVLVERNPAKGSNPIEFLAQGLGSDHSLIIFPEGTRGQNPECAPFKSGIYRLALMRPDVELVPVYLENLNRVLPKGEFVPVPLLSRVAFGPPIRVEPGEEKDTFLTRARDAVMELRRW